MQPKFTEELAFIFETQFLFKSLSCKIWKKSLVSHFHIFFKFNKTDKYQVQSKSHKRARENSERKEGKRSCDLTTKKNTKSV